MSSAVRGSTFLYWVSERPSNFDGLPKWSWHVFSQITALFSQQKVIITCELKSFKMDMEIEIGEIIKLMNN
jgi:hypothetical protein